MIFIGIAGFLLFALGDANDVYFKSRLLKLAFPLGVLALICASLLALDIKAGISVLWCVLGTFFLLLELYTLFGAFPADEAYVKSEGRREVYTKGVYALCRHPGVLFFFGIYICASLGLNLPWLHTAAYSALNIALIIFEDICIFPKLLLGYDDYKKTTPFLIPNFKSIKKMLDK